MLLAFRMWLAFLLFRTKPFTENDMTRNELNRLRAYVMDHPDEAKKKDFGMWLAFGYVRYYHTVRAVHDQYDFAQVPYKGWLSYLINFSAIWHKTGYDGYYIIIHLDR